ncbi:transposase [Pseudomonas sp. ML96]|uniref:transposase n=1 Tax=Pseudomonas sp. ML96 TaxID=1523503 RepID=UPI000A8B166F|nr:transposase [Pseudomonas sp. ML96]
MAYGLVARFNGLSDPDRIRQRVTVRPEALGDLSAVDPHVGAEFLRQSIKKIYIPGQFSVDFIARMINKAQMYSERFYASERDHVSRIYSHERGEDFPVCLTGLAGVGKSGTIHALRKALPDKYILKMKHLDGVVEACSSWYISARGVAGGKQALVALLGGERIPGDTAKLIGECARRSARDGVSILLLDETQSLGSGSGPVKAADMILTLASIGVPVVYVSNYSLIHKFKDGRAENKQRILSSPELMLPEKADSQDWRDFVFECVRVGGCSFSAVVDDLVFVLHRYSFGLKRLAVHLICIAYLEARALGRSSIVVSDIERAYKSLEFTSSRGDVEELNRIAVTGKSSRKDLLCPFDLPKDVQSNVVTMATSQRDERVTERVLTSSLSPSERVILDNLREEQDPIGRQKSGRPRGAKSVPAATAEDLGNNFEALLEGLPSGASKSRRNR